MVISWNSSDCLMYLSIKLKISTEAEIDEVHGSGYFDLSVFGVM